MKLYTRRPQVVRAMRVSQSKRQWKWTAHGRIAGMEYSAVFPRLRRRLDERRHFEGHWRYWIVGGGQIYEGDYLVSRGDLAWREPEWLFRTNYQRGAR